MYLPPHIFICMCTSPVRPPLVVAVVLQWTLEAFCVHHLIAFATPVLLGRSPVRIELQVVLHFITVTLGPLTLATSFILTVLAGIPVLLMFATFLASLVVQSFHTVPVSFHTSLVIQGFHTTHIHYSDIHKWLYMFHVYVSLLRGCICSAVLFFLLNNIPFINPNSTQHCTINKGMEHSGYYIGRNSWNSSLLQCNLKNDAFPLAFLFDSTIQAFSFTDY